MKIRRYSDVIQFETMKERYEYLKLGGEVGNPTFGSHRYMNQKFYTSPEWKAVRREVILRDRGCDLAFPDYELDKGIVIHHINPITIDDIVDENWDKLLDLDNLITTSYSTHQAIHYGTESLMPKMVLERHPGDTKLW